MFYRVLFSPQVVLLAAGALKRTSTIVCEVIRFVSAEHGQATLFTFYVSQQTFAQMMVHCNNTECLAALIWAGLHEFGTVGQVSTNFI
jgi:hypothetical protein